MGFLITVIYAGVSNLRSEGAEISAYFGKQLSNVIYGTNKLTRK